MIWILQKILAEHKLEEVKVKWERENASFVWVKLEGKRIAISVITNKMVRMKLRVRETTSPAKFTSSIADLFDVEVEDIEGCFRLVRSATNYIPTRSFIVRMLSGTIYSNNRLALLGIIKSAKCTYCQEPRQSRMHLMRDSEKVKELRNS